MNADNSYAERHPHEAQRTVREKAGRPRVVLVGGGVHAAVVADCIRAAGKASIIGYVDILGGDSAPMRRMGVTFLGGDEHLASLIGEGVVSAGVLGMAGLDHAQRRVELVARLNDIMPTWWTSIHPAAIISDSAKIDGGTLVMAGAVINPLAQIGCHVVVNTSAVVEHGCVVEDLAVLGPRAVLCGDVHVGAGAFVGAGAVVITGVSVGAGSVVGAGAVVIRDVPDHVTVVGNPARLIEHRACLEPLEELVAAY